MPRAHSRFAVAVALTGAALWLHACAATTDLAGAALVEPPSQEEPSASLDAGPGTPEPEEPMSQGNTPDVPGTPLGCGGDLCGPTEICCLANSQCVPAECEDCCPVSESEEAAPALPRPMIEIVDPTPPPPGDPWQTSPDPGPRPGVDVGAPGPTPPPPSPEG